MRKTCGMLLLLAVFSGCAQGPAVHRTQAAPANALRVAPPAAEADFVVPVPAESEELWAQRTPVKKVPPPAVEPPVQVEKSDMAPLNRRLIVYNARISVGVFEPEKSAMEVIAQVEKLGGYLSSRTNNDVVVRVPATHFFPFIQELEKLGHVTGRHIGSNDVTAQFVDLTIRLNNLMVTRTRLQAILEKARNVEETLRVEQELNRVSQDIEQIKGRLRYMQNLVDLSTVQVSFHIRHGQNPVTPNPIKVHTPIDWVKQFDVYTLFRN